MQILCEGFDECLTIKRVFPRNIGAQIKSGLIKNNIPLYAEDSAAVYISMLSDIGNVVKVSKNFSEVIPTVASNSEAIGKNIKFMMCEDIAEIHDTILIHSLEKKEMNQQIIYFPILVGKNLQGWSMPLEVKLQKYMFGTSEFGACGWIK